MIEQTSTEPQGKRRRALFWSIVALGVAVVFIALLWSFTQPGGRGLMPELPTPTPGTAEVSNEAAIVTFTELNSDPYAYVNRPIQVTGAMQRVAPPNCTRYTGPRFRWGLVSEGLRLNAVGYERIVPLLEEETTLTVQGIWRRYQGPLGCGKGPARGTEWYLDTRRILQPNPLVTAGGSVIPLNVLTGDQPLPTLMPTTAVTPTTPVATTAVTATATLPPAGTVPATSTGAPITPTLGAVTRTPSPTPAPGTGTPSGPVPNLTPTPGGNATASPQPSSTPELPDIPTATPGGGGYPGQPTATPTTSAYP